MTLLFAPRISIEGQYENVFLVALETRDGKLGEKGTLVNLDLNVARPARFYMSMDVKFNQFSSDGNPVTASVETLRRVIELASVEQAKLWDVPVDPAWVAAIEARNFKHLYTESEIANGAVNSTTTS